MTVRDLIAKLQALPEDAKGLPVLCKFYDPCSRDYDLHDGDEVEVDSRETYPRYRRIILF